MPIHSSNSELNSKRKPTRGHSRWNKAHQIRRSILIKANSSHKYHGLETKDRSQTHLIPWTRWEGNWEQLIQYFNAHRKGDIFGLSLCHCNDGGCGNEGAFRLDNCTPSADWSLSYWQTYLNCRIERNNKLHGIPKEAAKERARDQIYSCWRNLKLFEIYTDMKQSAECIHCGQYSEDVLPYSPVPIWLHSQCYPEWQIGFEQLCQNEFAFFWHSIAAE